jgi:hypothetical protein
MGITITAEQIAERDMWEEKLILKQCTLEQALIMVLHSGAPASRHLVLRMEHAFHAYQYGDCDDLAIPFGFAITRREKQQNRQYDVRSNVKFHVKSFWDQGYRILNPSDYPGRESAFTKTADLLKNVSAARAFDIYYDRDISKRGKQKPAKGNTSGPP